MLATKSLQIFWSKDELDLIFPSSLFEETGRKKDQIESEFLVTKPVSTYVLHWNNYNSYV